MRTKFKIFYVSGRIELCEWDLQTFNIFAECFSAETHKRFFIHHEKTNIKHVFNFDVIEHLEHIEDLD